MVGCKFTAMRTGIDSNSRNRGYLSCAFALILVCWSGCLVACGHRPAQQDAIPENIRERVSTRFGPPDKIVVGPDISPRPPEEGEGDAFPFEIWQYGHLYPIGEDVQLVFVDACSCGDYKLVPTRQSQLIRTLLSQDQ